MNRDVAKAAPPPAPAAKSTRVRKPAGAGKAARGPAFAKPSAKKTPVQRGKATRTQQRTPTTHKLRKPKAPRRPPSKR